MRCPVCATIVPTTADACANCGVLLNGAAAETTRTAAQGEASGADDRGSQSTGFQPGDIVAERYRIVALVGRGAMGEVYRADDLRLRQAVALKFLPPHLSRDADATARMAQEVRLARRIGHPNVCRVYDLGDSGGRQFLCMEFIDGEDLASLLRRIGRVPHEKGIEIAHQLCAGLSAAHAQGVLHRDLKPANVMLDGEGQGRRTDFGVAVAQQHHRERAQFAGTPLYMAPEQLRGHPASIQSDLYSLGIILRELLSGRRDVPEGSAVDPAISRVIAGCLQDDPMLRPRSAFEVDASLPGGDQLARLLAAGKTPSPRIVAAAGAPHLMPVSVAWACFGVVMRGLLFTAWAADRIMLFRLVPLDKPPDALEERLSQIISRLGINAAPQRSRGWRIDIAHVRYIADGDGSRDRWVRLLSDRPGVIQFWSRRGPSELIARGSGGVINLDNPPLQPDTINVSLDSDGRLVELVAVPPAMVVEEPGTSTPDWTRFFEEAGLSAAAFVSTHPMWTPPVAYDRITAWQGPDSAPLERRVQVIAATFRNRVSYFALKGPWMLVPIGTTGTFEPINRFRLQYQSLMQWLVVAIALVLAQRNWRLGRSDVSGGRRVAAAVALLGTFSWVVRADHTRDMQREWGLLSEGVGFALFTAGTAFVLYLALEPMVRRRWPHALVSWSRMVAGRLRDPLVGRDVLVGMAAGAVVMALFCLNLALPGWLGWPPHRPSAGNLQALTNWRYALQTVASIATDAVLMGYTAVVILILRRAAVRHETVSYVLFVAVSTLVFLFRGEYLVPELLFAVTQATLCLVVLVRFGVLSAIVLAFCWQAVQFLPIALEMSQWYSNQIVLSLAILIGIAAYGVYAATLGQRLPARFVGE